MPICPKDTDENHRRIVVSNDSIWHMIASHKSKCIHKQEINMRYISSYLSIAVNFYKL